MLFREGDQADTFYVIRHGSVALEIFAPPSGAVTVETVEAGQEAHVKVPLRAMAPPRGTLRIAGGQPGVKLFVGHVVRYFHEFEQMKAQIHAGKIGEPGWVKLTRGGIFPGGPKSWFANYGGSGGVTLDCMIHDLDWVRYVFGEPERIFCQALMRGGDHPMDYSQVTMRMKSGLIATVIGTWAHPAGFRVTAEICGSDGMLQYDSAQAPVSALKRSDGLLEVLGHLLLEGMRVVDDRRHRVAQLVQEHGDEPSGARERRLQRWHTNHRGNSSARTPTPRPDARSREIGRAHV